MNGKWALITGASSGFGVNYAEIFAREGTSLILTARRAPHLEDLASSLKKEYQIEVLCLPFDLSIPSSPSLLYEEIKRRGLNVEFLINNAGYGIYGPFTETSWEKLQAMLQVDVMALTQLTSLVAQDMKKRGSGHILLVSSIAAYQPSPTYAAYAAAKAYVLHLGEALNFELKNFGIKVSVVSPGVTETDFLKVAGQNPSLYQRLVMMKSKPVAELAIRGLKKGVPSIVPGVFNKISVYFIKILPVWIQVRMVNLLMRI